MRRKLLHLSLVLGCATASWSRTADADETRAPQGEEHAVPLPAPAADVETDTEMNSPGMLIGGAITAALGAGTLGTGLGLYLAGSEANDECNAAAAASTASFFVPTCGLVGLGHQIIGIPMMVGGGVLTLVGVPLIVAGAWPVPVEQVEVVVGPGTMGLHGTF